MSLASRPGTSGIQEVGARSWALREGTGDWEGGRGKGECWDVTPGARVEPPRAPRSPAPFSQDFRGRGAADPQEMTCAEARSPRGNPW